MWISKKKYEKEKMKIKLDYMLEHGEAEREHEQWQDIEKLKHEVKKLKKAVKELKNG